MCAGRADSGFHLLEMLEGGFVPLGVSHHPQALGIEVALGRGLVHVLVLHDVYQFEWIQIHKNKILIPDHSRLRHLSIRIPIRLILTILLLYRILHQRIINLLNSCSFDLLIFYYFFSRETGCALCFSGYFSDGEGGGGARISGHCEVLIFKVWETHLIKFHVLVTLVLRKFLH